MNKLFENIGQLEMFALKSRTLSLGHDFRDIYTNQLITNLNTRNLKLIFLIIWGFAA